MGTVGSQAENVGSAPKLGDDCFSLFPSSISFSMFFQKKNVGGAAANPLLPHLGGGRSC